MVTCPAHPASVSVLWRRTPVTVRNFSTQGPRPRVPTSSEEGAQEGDEKDEKPMRVGTLERVKPTTRLIDTPKHTLTGHPGLLWAQVQGRRQDLGPDVNEWVRTLEG